MKPPGPAADEGAAEPKVDVKFRVSASERAAAEVIASRIGLSLPDAMRTCFRRFVLQGGLPFPMVVSSGVREPATGWARPPATRGPAVLATLGGDRIAALCRRFGVELGAMPDSRLKREIERTLVPVYGS